LVLMGAQNSSALVFVALSTTVSCGEPLPRE